ncbi:hypothetical protein [Aliarcobacter lanthieri]|uniref:hypothetical protein n=1 Tax=Aliarcobacter lanthieri TaxID=1355374 RepID=UPI003AAEC207
MNELYKGIILAVITAILTFLGSYFLYFQELKIEKLDLNKDFETNYFSKPKFLSNEIKLLVNGEEKNQLGIMKISLLNFTTKNFSDIPIKIRITPKNKEQFKILAYSAVGEKEFYNNINEDKKMYSEEGTYYFSYVVSSLNRVDKPEYGLQLRILFEGNEEPKVDISAKNVSIQDFDISHSPYYKELNFKIPFFAILFIVCVLIFTILVVGPIISLLSKKSDLKRKKKYAEEIFNALKQNAFLENKSDEELKDFVAKILYTQQIELWNKKKFWDKWSVGMISPKIDDYKF